NGPATTNSHTLSLHDALPISTGPSKGDSQRSKRPIFRLTRSHDPQMTPIHLAIFWHQHQPYYPDDVSGETLMPWVRLHGTKDYYGMALHLKEVPEFQCTIKDRKSTRLNS